MAVYVVERNLQEREEKKRKDWVVGSARTEQGLKAQRATLAIDPVCLAAFKEQASRTELGFFVRFDRESRQGAIAARVKGTGSMP